MGEGVGRHRRNKDRQAGLISGHKRRKNKNKKGRTK